MTASSHQQNAATTAGNNGFSLISNQKLLRLYTSLLKCRMIAERISVLSAPDNATGQGDTGGQEAPVVGAAIDLLPEDAASVSGRNFALDFMTGVPLERICKTLFDRTANRAREEQLNLATGMALVNKKREVGKIAAIFSAGGSGLPGLWHEAMKTARAQQLPILFVWQKNVLAEAEKISSPHEVEGVRIMGSAREIPSIAVDGSDVVAVYRVATEAIAHARKGNGPTLIECVVERSKAHDSILNMEAYLRRKGLFSEKMKLEVASGFRKELDAAIKLAKLGRLCRT